MSKAAAPAPDPACQRTAVLLQRCRSDDAAALAELSARYYPRVARIVRVRMGERLQARHSPDDVVQNVFLRVLRSIREFEPRSEGSFVAWIATLVNHELATLASRASTPGPRAADESHVPGAKSPTHLPAPTEGVGTKVAKAELVAILDRLVAQLEDHQREVILLRDYAGCDWKTVAEHMRASNPRATEGSCQELYGRACARLATAMKRVTKG